MMPVYGNLAATLALKELSDALATLDVSFDKLPDVKNKDGDSITDVKEKRLALVRKHITAAGDIINLNEQAVAQTQMAVQATLVAKYKDTIKAALMASGAPKQIVDSLDDPALMVLGDEGQCDCPDCQADRASEAARDEPFGFAAGVKRMKEAKDTQ